MTDESSLPYEPGVLPVLQSKQETRHYYNKIAKVYDLLSEEAEKPMREAGLQLLAAQPGEHILEVGFGTGHCLVEIAKAVGPKGKALGIDISERMTELAAELLEREGLAERVELRTGDAEQLPFDSDRLDGIFFSFTLELFSTRPICPRCWPSASGRCGREGGSSWSPFREKASMA